MKKTIVLFVACLAAVQFTLAQQKKPATAVKPKPKTVADKSTAPVLKNALDSLSYAIGIIDGNFFKMQGVDAVNPQMIAKGFNDIYKNAGLMTTQQADQCIRTEMQKMARKKVQPELEAGEKFMTENRKKPGVVQLPSGLQYQVIKMGDGPKPADTSTVKVHYDGFLLNGTKFDSSRDRGEPVTYPVNQFIRGWTEGLQLMPVGSIYKFYVPSHIGYGDMGSPPTIPGGATLVFEVELLEIVK